MAFVRPEVPRRHLRAPYRRRRLPQVLPSLPSIQDQPLSDSSATLEREGDRMPAAVVSANKDADRCVLRVSNIVSPFPHWVRVRPYADVKVGERVFTVGAPRGLELSLADGIISSKRTADSGRYFQTSAPISKGSSGGGLFDAQGNLVGITTFMIKDAQNVNFAIAAEEYAK
jgi:S1-C subfamily serine protease